MDGCAGSGLVSPEQRPKELLALGTQTPLWGLEALQHVAPQLPRSQSSFAQIPLGTCLNWT